MPTKRIHPNEPQDQLNRPPEHRASSSSQATHNLWQRLRNALRLTPGGQRTQNEPEPFDLPFLYEIRVKGRLADEQWASWFDNLKVTYKRGESVLRGEVPDHAALYGLLARLRDLAVPLVAVRVLDSDAQLTLNKKLRRVNLMINSLIALIYLLLLGGLVTATVYLSMAINVALALTLLFAALAGMAHVFYLWCEGRFWRGVMWFMGVCGLGSFIVWIPVSDMLPLWMSLPITFAVLAGLVYYGIEALRRRADDLKRSSFGNGDPAHEPIGK